MPSPTQMSEDTLLVIVNGDKAGTLVFQGPYGSEKPAVIERPGREVTLTYGALAEALY